MTKDEKFWSRSQKRRIAAQKGLPVPDFSKAVELPKELPLLPFEHFGVETRNIARQQKNADQLLYDAALKEIERLEAEG